MLRKTLCRLLCVIAIICLTATSVFAAGYFNGSDRLGSISFHFNNGEISVTGGSVELRMHTAGIGCPIDAKNEASSGNVPESDITQKAFICRQLYS